MAIKEFIDYVLKLFTWWTVIMPWQQGIRVTLGKSTRLIGEGVYFKIPILHTVYVQEKRLRVVVLPVQTISTKDQRPITISCNLSYQIVDVMKLYNSLYQPDLTLVNLVAGKIAKIITSLDYLECTPEKIEMMVSDELKSLDYGLDFKGISIVNFTAVKTFRLIQDSTWVSEGIDLNQSNR